MIKIAIINLYLIIKWKYSTKKRHLRKQLAEQLSARHHIKKKGAHCDNPSLIKISHCSQYRTECAILHVIFKKKIQGEKSFVKVNKYPMASFFLVLRNIDHQQGQTALSSVCLFRTKKQKFIVVLTDHLIHYLDAFQWNRFIRQLTGYE